MHTYICVYIYIHILINKLLYYYHAYGNATHMYTQKHERLCTCSMIEFRPFKFIFQTIYFLVFFFRSFLNLYIYHS